VRGRVEDSLGGAAAGREPFPSPEGEAEGTGASGSSAGGSGEVDWRVSGKIPVPVVVLEVGDDVADGRGLDEMRAG